MHTDVDGRQHGQLPLTILLLLGLNICRWPLFLFPGHADPKVMLGERVGSHHQTVLLEQNDA